ncbi:MAG: hypothetical protein HUK00_00760 [Bacteroidaceae bacterium]|nr:hypothetical protein [Bacteroidaceae bacterium]
MMKKFFSLFLISLLTLAATAQAQVMSIKMTDGAVVKYPLASIQEITVGNDASAFVITSPSGEKTFFDEIPSMLRVVPTVSTNPTEFAFGTVTAETGHDLTKGEYALYVSLSASVVYTGLVDIAEQPESYTVKLYSYKDGALDQMLASPVSGTIYSKVDAKKGLVTLQIDATFADGTNVRGEWGPGVPVAVTTLDDLLPGEGEVSQLIAYAPDGSTLYTTKVTGINAKLNDKGRYELQFTLENSTAMPSLVIDASIVNAGRIDNLHNITDKYIKIAYSQDKVDIRNYTDVESDSEAHWSRHFTEQSNAFVDVRHDDTTDKWSVSFATSDYYYMYGVQGYGYRIELTY